MRGLRLAGLASAAVTTVAATIMMVSPASAALLGAPIKSNANQLCLQPEGGSFAQGAPVVQVTCDTTSPFQRWRVDAASGSVRRMKNTATGLCLDAQGGAVDGTPVVQWTCNSISNERWERQPFDGRLISRVSGTRTHCLDVPFSQSTQGLQVWIYGCNGTVAQSWDLSDVIEVPGM